jgi:hypothetical protein
MQKQSTFSRSFLFGSLAGGLGIATVMIAAFLAGRATVPGNGVPGEGASKGKSGPKDSDWLEQRYLNATASHGADTMAIATGPIDDSEGLFVLDYLTGELTCYVLNSRSGKFDAGFKSNVIQALGVEPAKKPKYLMVTGAANFPRGIGGSKLGQCAIYVVDSNTGHFGVWGVPFSRQAAATGNAQWGPLFLINTGKARNIALE